MFREPKGALSLEPITFCSLACSLGTRTHSDMLYLQEAFPWQLMQFEGNTKMSQFWGWIVLKEFDLCSESKALFLLHLSHPSFSFILPLFHSPERKGNNITVLPSKLIFNHPRTSLCYTVIVIYHYKLAALMKG